MQEPSAGVPPDEYEDSVSLLELAEVLRQHLTLLIAGPLLVGLAALGIAFALTPTFTARTSLIPPQQQQSVAASALASLGALSGLAGAAGAVRTPSDQYVALMQSTTVADRLIDQFDLMQAYDEKLRFDARRELHSRSSFQVGKKDGLIVIEVDDESPKRAADIANQYVEELRRMTAVLAVSEAQQRRAFFETQLKNTRDQLVRAQQALQASGFNQGALRAEPKAAAEGYARLKAETTAAEVRLQTLRGMLSDSAVEVQQQQAALNALRGQLARLEQAGEASAGAGPDYISKYREFKYQETLFELFSRQYELARVDEAREGALIQVVDPALPPERKSKPKRAQIALVSALGALLGLCAFVLVRHFWRQTAAEPEGAEKVARLRAALGRR
jgi:uncharacterized protein involved in exopolysaccharide biosynthesis